MSNLFQKKLQEKPFLIVSHRGFWGGNIIENSLESMQLGFEAGADIVEIDVCRTVDGAFYVFHDGAEPKLYRQTKRFFDWTKEEVDTAQLLNTLASPSGKYAIPLDVFLNNVPKGHLINVDRSWKHWEQGLLDILSSTGFSEQILLKSPMVPEYLELLNRHPDPIPYMPILATWEDLAMLEQYPNINVVGIEIIVRKPEHPGHDPKFIQYAHDRGWFTFANCEVLSENNPLFLGYDDDLAVREGYDAAWGALLDMGIDVIQTDWPNFLHDYRETRTKAYLASLEASLDLDSALDVHHPKAYNIPFGKNLDQLIPQYGLSYYDDPALKRIAETMSAWQFVDAMQLVTDRLQERPDDIEVRLLCAEVLCIMDHYERAFNVVVDAIRIDHENLQALALGAILSRILRKEQLEQEYLTDLHRLSPAAFDEVMDLFANVAASQSPYYLNPPIDDDAPQAIAIYGEQLQPDGSMPARLVERVEMAIELLKQFPEAICIPSGGSVHTDYAEADVMAAYLEEHGIDAHRVVRDAQAKDTVGNAIGVKKIMEERGLFNVTVVTSWSHIRRAALALELLSLSENGSLFVTAMSSGVQGDMIQPIQEKRQTFITAARCSHLFTKADFERFLA